MCRTKKKKETKLNEKKNAIGNDKGEILKFDIVRGIYPFVDNKLINFSKKKKIKKKFPTSFYESIRGATDRKLI